MKNTTNNIVDIVNIATTYGNIRATIKDNNFWFVARDILFAAGKRNCPYAYVKPIPEEHIYKDSIVSRKNKLMVNMIDAAGVDMMFDHLLNPKQPIPQTAIRDISNLYDELINGVASFNPTKRIVHQMESEIEDLSRKYAELHEEYKKVAQERSAYKKMYEQFRDSIYSINQDKEQLEQKVAQYEPIVKAFKMAMTINV